MEPPNYKGGMAVVALVLFGACVAVTTVILGIVMLLTHH